MRSDYEDDSFDEYDNEEPQLVDWKEEEAGGEGEAPAEQKVDYTNKVIVENVSYLPAPGIKRKKFKFLDKSFVFDLPDWLIQARESKPRREFEDLVETYIYNLVSKITKFQVARCQIFLGDLPNLAGEVH